MFYFMAVHFFWNVPKKFIYNNMIGTLNLMNQMFSGYSLEMLN